MTAQNAPESRPQVTIFYSWQSDLPNPTNRGFIQKALEDAIKALHVDDSVTVEPVLDRDTQGQAGSPNIAETIFRKIDHSAVFVADVSIIGTAGDDHRPTPNPNVLVELGYALKRLGDERVLLVVNIAFGKAELLPFDLRTRRIVAYNMPKDGERGDERRNLARTLVDALKATLAAAQPRTASVQSPADVAISAIERQAPDQAAVVRRYMGWLSQQISNLTADLRDAEPSQFDRLITNAIDDSVNLVADFGRVARRIAEMNSAVAARAMYEGFTGLLAQYEAPRGFSSVFYPQWFDVAKFLGHELFVMLFANLIREERWEIVGDLLDREIFFPNPPNATSGSVPFTELSEYVRSLEQQNQAAGRISVRADILNRRHSEGAIAGITPIDDFVAADIFLNLRAVATTEGQSHGFDWRPWSLLYLQEVPRFLRNIRLRGEAEKLLPAIGVSNVGELRSLLAQRLPQLGTFYGHNGWLWHNPLSDFDSQSVGTK